MENMSYNDNYPYCYGDYYESDYMYSSVDCTLSLGTPSTRLSNENSNKTTTPRRNSVSSFCWELLQPNKQSSSSSGKSASRSSHRGGGGSGGSGGGDPLFVRRCVNCDTTSTPLWRNGPRGPKSLCNACGIRFKKEERRTAALANTVGGGTMDSHHGYHNESWAAPNELRFIENDSESDSSSQFLPWLNYDRPSGFVHDFTR